MLDFLLIQFNKYHKCDCALYVELRLENKFNQS